MLWLGVSVTLGLASGCQEDGTNSHCPELPLYNLRSDAALDENIIAARETAAAAGCITLAGDASQLGQTDDLDAGQQDAGQKDAALRDAPSDVRGQ